MSQIRLIIADEMLPIREYLQMELSREADIKVIDVVGTGIEAINRALSTYPDVMLMDLDMRTSQTAVGAIKMISTLVPDIRLIVLALFVDDDIFIAFEEGACDYILKNYSTSEILEAIRMVANDISPLRLQIARMIRSEPRTFKSEGNILTATLNTLFRLSPMELGILRLLAKEIDELEIAGLQRVESSIIRAYIGNILKKFDESSVNDILKRLSRLGITHIFTNEGLRKVN